MQDQRITISFFEYNNRLSKCWAFSQFLWAHLSLYRQPGLSFYKKLGVGRGLSDPRPNLSRYAILQVWDTEKAAKDFFADAKLAIKMKTKSDTHTTLWLACTKSVGLWNKKNPFTPQKEITQAPILVLTRATIKLKLLRYFWSQVPAAATALARNSELVFTAGVGERPFTRMATLSIWKSEEGIKKFAYRDKNHRQAIAQTQALQWYSEELFARFTVYQATGNAILVEQMNQLITKD